MTRIELNQFRGALRDRQAALGEDIGKREALTLESSPDELDRIQHARDRDYAIGNLERNFEQLQQVRSALRGLDAGTFGICAGCEGDIDPRRLAAIPWAASCIVCQEAFDRGQPAALDRALPRLMAA